MDNSFLLITPLDVFLSVIPVVFVVLIFIKWSLGYKNILYAISRMLVQLIIIGYFLAFIFKANQSWIVVAVLTVMISFSAWISLRTVQNLRFKLLKYALYSILLGAGLTLLFITQIVFHLNPWYEPRYMVPLAGMVFASAMNSISLAAERYFSEIKRNEPYIKVRNTAFRASLIPIINSLFAVGLVSLPGMMTGQILSGVSPLVAIRYQIVVMCMLLCSAGFSSFLFLTFLKVIPLAEEAETG